MEDSQKDRLRDYAWSYFAYHAEQRMKTFHFYLILVLAIMAGFVTLMAKSNAPDFKALSALPFLLTVFSVLFAFLDRRNKELVRNGEAAVKYLDELENLEDSEGLPNVLKIFARDDPVVS